MAIMANISEAHFSRNFKLVFKVPPLQYQIQRRIDKAAELLRRTNLTISEVCTFIGFDNLSTFSRSFKKVYGIGPKVYRSYNNIYINSK
jgi:AraC-like DNA-binding protein